MLLGSDYFLQMQLAILAEPRWAPAYSQANAPQGFYRNLWCGQFPLLTLVFPTWPQVALALLSQLPLFTLQGSMMVIGMGLITLSMGWGML